MEETKIIGNKSEGHNYHYASLADIARQGITIPEMRVTYTVGEKDSAGNPIEYIEALIDGEWRRGARVVVPSSTRMNEAQAYGSALTYARRYTVLTLLGIACDDDDKIEAHSEADQKANENAAKEELAELYEKAGGADFERWFQDSTKKGFDGKAYASMKATLLKQINRKLEGEKK